jgi:hypothetical protein
LNYNFGRSLSGRPKEKYRASSHLKNKITFLNYRSISEVNGKVMRKKSFDDYGCIDVK